MRTTSQTTDALLTADFHKWDPEEGADAAYYRMARHAAEMEKEARDLRECLEGIADHLGCQKGAPRKWVGSQIMNAIDRLRSGANTPEHGQA